MDVTCFEKNLELIDISSEDDFLIASPLRHSLDDFRFSVALENTDEEDVVDFFRAIHGADVRKKTDYSASIDTGILRNSRNSLAWDSAFFTSPGVLDPYELSIINKGYKEVEDPISYDDDLDASLDSDGFSVGSSECELFEDVRASVHRSFSLSSWKSGLKEAIKHNDQSLKKVDAVYHQHGTLSKPINRKGTAYIRGSTSTEKAKTPQKNTKTALVTHKPPKVVKGRNSPVSASASASAARTKRSSSKQLVSLPSKIAKCAVPGTPRTPILPKPASHKFTSRYDLGGYSVSSSACFSSESSLKSRGKVDSRKAKSLSVTELPCKTPSKNKLTNHYYYSPCGSAVSSSSIDGFSSVRSSCSSTSSSSTNRLSKGPNSLRDTTPPVFSYDLHSSQWILSPNQLIQENKSSSSTESRRNGKPSGLRMPSPKVGFFDEVNFSKQFSFGAQIPFSQPEKTTTLHNIPSIEISRRSSKKSGPVVPSKSSNLNNVSIERKRSGVKPRNLPKTTTTIRSRKDTDLCNKAGKKILPLGEKENMDVNSLSSQFGRIGISAS